MSVLGTNRVLLSCRAVNSALQLVVRVAVETEPVPEESSSLKAPAIAVVVHSRPPPPPLLLFIYFFYWQLLYKTCQHQPTHHLTASIDRGIISHWVFQDFSLLEIQCRGWGADLRLGTTGAEHAAGENSTAV